MEEFFDGGEQRLHVKLQSYVLEPINIASSKLTGDNPKYILAFPTTSQEHGYSIIDRDTD